MEPMHERPQGDRLSGVLAAYRQACPDVDAGPEFMPKLWQRIEARRRENLSIFKRFAQVCVATAALAVIVTSVLMPAPQENEALTSTYAEVLAADNADQALVAALPADIPGAQR